MCPSTPTTTVITITTTITTMTGRPASTIAVSPNILMKAHLTWYFTCYSSPLTHNTTASFHTTKFFSFSLTFPSRSKNLRFN
ncbi:hypothetical protein E2C01_090067 [Portunus trituberculatus]|uniref:Uncharacterized protein n=1 Tax=Portunus trituberculatus TaxID=210409 RepID=A0A5B7JP59_PORTR|nr:hypothetical protein [Portunus trituberculatus]